MRNITTNLEIHGESAWIDDFRQKRVDAVGRVSGAEIDAWSGLVGLRYLSSIDTASIKNIIPTPYGYS